MEGIGLQNVVNGRPLCLFLFVDVLITRMSLDEHDFEIPHMIYIYIYIDQITQETLFPYCR